MMRWIFKFPLRLRSLFRNNCVEKELSDELRFHLERLIEQNTARGITPEDARFAALRELGAVEQIKEECRDMRRTNYIENVLKDARYALRTLRRSPGFSTVVILTLALGIGANRAIFSLVDTIVLRPLPYPEADRLVALQEANRKGEEYSVSWLDFVDWRTQSRSFSAMAAIQGGSATLTGTAEAERLETLKTSSPFFSILGARLLLGRDFLDSDDRPGATPVAILSHSLWAQHFSSDPHVIGRSVDLSSPWQK
jgi:hypothetical protein